MNIESASLSDTGLVRDNNEDACGEFIPADEDQLRSRGALFVVADGMGGHRGGEIASRVAVDTIQSSYYSSPEEDLARALVGAFDAANASILGLAMSDSTLFGMGTTCTALVLRDGQAHFGHVGDSRAYLYRGGDLRQITEDHSLVGEMVRSGIITDEDARVHPKRNVITRSLGVQQSIVTDTPETPMAVSDGDVFVLCSDGLTSYATKDDLSSALGRLSPDAACRELVDVANQRGGRDNVTVVVIAVRSTRGGGGGA
jgi:serine/threonine protein phosphatase PrpC